MRRFAIAGSDSSSDRRGRTVMEWLARFFAIGGVGAWRSIRDVAAVVACDTPRPRVDAWVGCCDGPGDALHWRAATGRPGGLVLHFTAACRRAGVVSMPVPGARCIRAWRRVDEFPRWLSVRLYHWRVATRLSFLGRCGVLRHLSSPVHAVSGRLAACCRRRGAHPDCAHDSISYCLRCLTRARLEPHRLRFPSA
ncbi:hypothetical protein XOCgx_3267 [Xanthomonas oryzae pv. oryzicola]|nr:hypothetical protein XOCgx_3267 [Xanthomonas oryzae pv. oryzicola]